MPQLKENEIKSITEEYKNGLGTERLAKKYGCTRRTIRLNLIKLGIFEVKRGFKNFTNDEIEIIKEQYNNHIPFRHIADS
jgi:hypothetical protein